MRTKTIVGNWKMHTNLAEATVLASQIAQGTSTLKHVEVVICPPFTWLVPLAEIFKKNMSHIHLGAQNIFYKDEGAFTGEISPSMLSGICDYVIIGHSERRVHFKEDDDVINLKTHACLKQGLKIILCVGEFKKLNVSSRVSSFSSPEDESSIHRQLSLALEGVSEQEIKNVIIAYEPVWAIGTGKYAAAAYVSNIIESIRNRLVIMYNREVAEQMKILYGGSVKLDNADSYLKRSEIDGILVGGASLVAKEFIQICEKGVK